MNTQLDQVDTKIFEEFELDFAEKRQSLNTFLETKIKNLKEAEQQRIEYEKREKEHIALQKQKEEQDKLKAELEEKERKLKEEQAQKEAELAERERKIKIAEQKRLDDERKAKEEAINKELQAKKAKELEAIKPDLEKLQSIIENIGISKELPKFENEKSKTFLVNILSQISDLKSSLIDELNAIKNI